MEWKRIISQQETSTPSGIVYVQEIAGWQCSTPVCRNTRWSRPGEDRRPTDQCELCCGQ